MEIRHAQKKRMITYITNLYKFVMASTQQRFRREVYNIKPERPEGNSTKINQNKENRNTRTRKQWKHELPESKR